MSLRDHIVSRSADFTWKLFQVVNSRIPEGHPIYPGLVPAPLLKIYERSTPPLGYPRETHSLCPDCVKEVRESILMGRKDVSELADGNPGEIRARIIEENGNVLMRKEYPDNGSYKDVLSIDTEFSRLIEGRFPGRNFRSWGMSIFTVMRHPPSSTVGVRY